MGEIFFIRPQKLAGSPVKNGHPHARHMQGKPCGTLGHLGIKGINDLFRLHVQSAEHGAQCLGHGLVFRIYGGAHGADLYADPFHPFHKGLLFFCKNTDL
ncbi:hypothetical protein SAMN02910291_01881 [Desulfovibrio desulfuricans]|uniref:Uncharacterized protein n=1 Tax=Desulfovibrio desulfuricans TaxID=876 RepID=A0AA94HTM7_DESDE|nr:hypothetical protein SAMN02910291_01881 [Desulfovibrio desulfuricans]SPD35414.1 Hypothetical protein DSVG11_1312 [Desulfovibrio sp. G11]